MKTRLVVFCFMLLTFSGVFAQTSRSEQPGDTLPSAAPVAESKQKTGDCGIIGATGGNWVDKLHGYLNANLCTPAVWFDGFFSNTRIDREVRPGSSVRWQHDYIENEFGQSLYTSKVRASFKLPKASHRVRLLFESDPDNIADTSVTQGNTPTPTGTQSQPRLGLLLGLKKTPRTSLNLRVTLRPSMTIRYRYSQPITDHFTTQFTQQLFRENSINGTSSQIDFIESFSRDLILRQSNQVRNTADNPAAEWRSSLVLFQRLNAVSALSYEAGYNGINKPTVFATNIRLGIRYRRQFYRQWLFYEVAPEVTWPRLSLEEPRVKTAAVFFRIEINFVNL